MHLHYTRGVSIPQNKEPAASREIQSVSPKESVLLPLCHGDIQHCTLRVEVGGAVKRGSTLARANGDQTLHAIATVSGTLLDVQPLYHPLFGEITCGVIRPEQETPAPAKRPAKPETLSPQKLLESVRLAGVIDELDGVPLHIKLQEWQTNNRLLRLAVDATEPEPYASSAWKILETRGEDVWQGAQLAATAAHIPAVHIAERLAPARHRLLVKQLGAASLFRTRARYPVARYGAEDDDRLCRIGVQACLALYEAVTYGTPHMDGVVTVAGDAVATPKNLRVPFGTTLAEVLQVCGLSADPAYVIVGDAMTGMAAPSLDIPILPGVTCILALSTRTIVPARPCMGCGRCAAVCHAGLLPYEIVRRLENMHYERLPSLCPGECDGCGACAHVCPAGRDVTAKVLEARSTEGTVFLNWGDDEDA